MSRTIARRLATLGGALGVAVLACAGTASATTVSAPAHVGLHSVTAYGAHPVNAEVIAVRGDDKYGKKPCHHRHDRKHHRGHGIHHKR